MSDAELFDGPDRPRSSRAARGAFAAFAFSARAMQTLSAFVVTLVAARHLTPQVYGVYAIVIVFITLIQTLTYTGLYHFIVTSKGEDRAVLSTGFWLVTGATTLAALALALTAPGLAALFDAPELTAVLLALCALQPLAGAGAWSSAVLLRRERMQAHFAVMFVTALAALAGGILALVLWQSLWALVAYRAIRVISANLLYAAILRERPAFALDRALARAALRYSGGLYGGRLLGFLSRYSGDLLLGLFFSTAEAGLYRFGARIAAGATDIVTQTMQSFALGQLGAAARAGRDLAPLVTRFTGTTVLLAGGVATTVAIIGPAAVDVWFDPAYLGAVAVIHAMSARAVFGIGLTMLDPVMAALGKTGAVMRLNLWLTLAGIALALATAPFGLAALAWSQAALAALASLLALRAIAREGGVDMAGARRAWGRAAGLVALYGAGLWGVWLGLGQIPAPGAGPLIGAGLAAALTLATLTLLAGWRLRLFSLASFSG